MSETRRQAYRAVRDVPSPFDSHTMDHLVLWRWGIICLIAGVFGWVLMACAQAMRPPAFPPWLDEYPEEDEEEEPASQ